MLEIEYIINRIYMWFGNLVDDSRHGIKHDTLKHIVLYMNYSCLVPLPPKKSFNYTRWQ